MKMKALKTIYTKRKKKATKIKITQITNDKRITEKKAKGLI